MLDLIRRPEGASVKEIMATTGWLAHSVRGFVSGGLVKKMALKVEPIERESGGRAYHLAGDFSRTMTCVVPERITVPALRVRRTGGRELRPGCGV